jgi:hypothetical protein
VKSFRCELIAEAGNVSSAFDIMAADDEEAKAEATKLLDWFPPKLKGGGLILWEDQSILLRLSGSSIPALYE